MRVRFSRQMSRFCAFFGTIATASVLCAPVSPSAQAAEGSWSRAPEIESRLISAVDGVGGLESIPAGLQITLPEGWKTYWRSPGDAGLPVTVDWAASGNVADVAFAWPAPHRFTLFGLDTFGYEREVVFPLTVVPEVPGQPVTLKGQVNALVCSDICIPHTLNVSLDLPQAAAGADGASANLIDRFDSLVPDGGQASGFSVARVTAAGGAGENGAILVEAQAREPFEGPDVIIETGSDYAFAAPLIEISADNLALTARFDLLHEPEPEAPLTGLPVTLTIVDGPRAMEAQANAGAEADAAAQGAAQAGGLSLLAMIGIALTGGLILNLMPCVLPVLSLKLFSLASFGGAGDAVIRRGFLATVAGILASFAVLGGAIIAAKAAGASVGWGLQFQQPLFLVLMIAILVLFAANLWGVFDIGLNRTMADGAVAATAGHGMGGHFATGAFAALLATPCSAPFVGTAVAFAVTRGPVEIMVIFLALGLGLAAPYLAVAAVPRLAGMLPKPGRWMIGLKRVLAVALFATGLWLAWVLSASTSLAASLFVVGLAALAALMLGWRGLPRFVPAGTALASLALAFAVPSLAGTVQQSAGTAVSRTQWAPFDEAAIAGHVTGGEVVFVDVTADWCLTCKVNKALVLDQGEVAGRLSDGSVRTLQADWTLPDEQIAAYLARNSRYGIPFDIVYGPGAPQGIVLPELLSSQAVLDALRAAGS